LSGRGADSLYRDADVGDSRIVHEARIDAYRICEIAPVRRLTSAARAITLPDILRIFYKNSPRRQSAPFLGVNEGKANYRTARLNVSWE